ncbi:MAG: TRAM domain-containing protein, partial [Gemmatimonadales bacterium]|nr:TRAM domain-containing protein [Gemmatimonadales bacterium]
MNDKPTDNPSQSSPDKPAGKAAGSNPDAAPVESLSLKVEKLVTGGAGLARHDGLTVFVPLTAPGDQVQARIVERKKGFAQAALETILEPGPDRREAPCPHYGQCGGCDFQHLEPVAQLKAKAEIVADCFKRLGKMDVSDILVGPEPCVPKKPGESGEPGEPGIGVRNRIRMYANLVGHYGMMRRGTHDVVPLESCLLMPEQFNRDIMPWLRMLPPVEELIVRLDGRGNWLISIFGPPNRLRMLKKILAAVPMNEPPAPGCVGLLFNNLPIWGRDYLVYEVAGHKFKVGAQSFFQGNLAATEFAVAEVRSWLGEVAEAGTLGPLLGDLFCGAGLFSLTLADLFEKIVAIDSDPYAIRDAENNVKRSEAVEAGKMTVRKGKLAVALRDPKLASAEEWT